MTNKFKKYCPNVYVAECEQKQKKGDIINLETKYGKEVEVVIYNHVGYTGTKESPKYCYSFVRMEDKTYAQKKAEKYGNASQKSESRSDAYFEAANEGRDFLSLGEPIKVGHHSEKRHRALIERNWNRVEKALECEKKAKEQARRAEYWESKADEITLAMPESLEFFNVKLEQAINYHAGLKKGTIEREHTYSLIYANNAVKDLKKKVALAEKLWGENNEIV